MLSAEDSTHGGVSKTEQASHSPTGSLNSASAEVCPNGSTKVSCIGSERASVKKTPATPNSESANSASCGVGLSVVVSETVHNLKKESKSCTFESAPTASMALTDSCNDAGDSSRHVPTTAPVEDCATLGMPADIGKHNSGSSSEVLMIEIATNDTTKSTFGCAELPENVLPPAPTNSPRSKSPTKSPSGVPRIVTRVFRMAAIEQRRGAPPASEACMETARATGASVNASRSSRTGDLTLVVRGTHAAVDAARRALWARLGERVSVAVDVPAEALGAIIGKGGRGLARISESTGARIDIPKPYSGSVVILGNAVCVSAAREMVLEVVADVASRSSAQLIAADALVLAAALDVPCGRPRDVIAAACAKPHPLFEGLSVRVVSAPMSPVELSIAGQRVSVDALAAEWDNMISEGEKKMRTVSVDLPAHVILALAGPRGASLRALLSASFVFGESSVTVRSRREDTLAAVRALLDAADTQHCAIVPILHLSADNNLLSVYNAGDVSTTTRSSRANTPLMCQDALSMCGESFNGFQTSSRPTDEQRTLRGDYVLAIMDELRCGLVTSVAERYSVRVDAVTAPTAAFAVDGADRAAVAVAASEITDALVEARGWHTHAVVVDRQFEPLLRTVLPFRGASGMVLLLPPKDAHTLCVLYAAPPATADVSTVFEELAAAAFDPATLIVRKLTAHANLHAHIIGRGGNHLRELMAPFAHVRVAFVGDEAIVRGPSDAVDAAVSVLSAAVSHARTVSSIKEMELDDAVLAKFAINCDTKSLSHDTVRLARDNGVFLSLSDNLRVLRVTGASEKADQFENALRQAARMSAASSETVVSVPLSRIPLFVGRGGRGIRFFSERFGVTASVLKAKNTGAECADVVIRGNANALAAAEAYVRTEYVLERISERVVVDAVAAAHIRGRRAHDIATIHSVRLVFETPETAAHSAESGDSEQKTAILVQGVCAESVSKAIADIYAASAPVNESAQERKILISASEHSAMGRAGVAARALESLARKFSDLNVLVLLSDASAKECAVSVRGASEKLVDSAATEVAALAAAAPTYERAFLATDAIGRIIGVEGRTVRRLHDTYGVWIDTGVSENADAPVRGVYVSGPASKIPSAIRAIERIIGA